MGICTHWAIWSWALTVTYENGGGDEDHLWAGSRIGQNWWVFDYTYSLPILFFPGRNKDRNYNSSCKVAMQSGRNIFLSLPHGTPQCTAQLLKMCTGISICPSLNTGTQVRMSDSVANSFYLENIQHFTFQPCPLLF